MKSEEIKEQRREAVIQNKQKWIERDILQMMDLTEKLVNLYSEAKAVDFHKNFFSQQKNSGLFANTDTITELKALYEKNNDLYKNLHQLNDRLSTLANSFGDIKILQFSAQLIGVINLYSNSDNEAINWTAVATKAGELHQVLREKLIALRDV